MIKVLPYRHQHAYRFSGAALSLALFLSAIAGSMPVWAEDILPSPAKDDPRFQTIAYHQDRRVRLALLPGGDVTILFGPGERIAEVKLSDYAHYQVTLSQARDSVLLHVNPVPIAVAAPAEATMHLTSEGRDYNFVITAAAPSAVAPSVLRFTYAGSKSTSKATGARSAAGAQYRLVGNREVRPSMIRDDGAKMYLQWPPTAPMPAVFAIVHGREEMVNGAQRDSLFTIDRVFAHLVFRIDKLQAQALRRARDEPQ